MGEQTRVLVISNEEGITHAIREILQTSGYFIRYAANGQAGLDELSKDRTYDVIVIHLTPPELDGFSFLEELSTRSIETSARIIMLSPLADSDSKANAFSLGAAEFIAMPGELDDLPLKIETQVNLLHSIRALQESEARFRHLAENSPDLVIIMEVFSDSKERPDGLGSQIVYINHSEAFGYSKEELSAEEFIFNIHPNDVSKVLDQRIINNHRHVKAIEFRIRSKEGNWEWVESRSAPLSDPKTISGAYSILITYKIITERKQLEFFERARSRVLEAIARDMDIEEALEKLNDVIENRYGISHTKFFLFHANHLLDINHFRSTNTNLGEEPDICNGCPLCFEGQACLQSANAGASVVYYQTHLPSADDHLTCQACVYVPGFSAQSVWCIPIQSIEGEVLGAYTICLQKERKPRTDDQPLFEMISQLASLAIERHQLREQLIFQAQHDALTGLMNLYTFTESLQSILQEAQRDERRIGLFFLDLDRFRWINETLGHFVGDQILIQVSERLKQFSGQTHALARVGADHYTLIAKQVEDIPMILGIGQSILDCITPPFYVGDHEILLTASMGISIYPEDGQDATVLLQHADQALQYAKMGGRNDFQRFNLRIGEQAARKLQLENNLRRAIERNEFSLNYQPFIQLDTGRIAGVEALIRWNSPELGPISPVDFIPLAEETGLIVPIGNWVLEEACRQMNRWTAAGTPLPAMSINISALQFQRDDFLTNVSYQIKHNHITPEKLILEVTESVLMQDLQRIVGRLNKLHGLGVQIWIDDFGTGYSSLQYLRRLPVSGLKIDRGFLLGLFPADETNESTNADPCFYRAIVDLGHSLNLMVLSEGVETEEQRELLVDLRCDLAQGFYFSRPMPAIDIEKHLS